jgi:hypothetical protein
MIESEYLPVQRPSLSSKSRDERRLARALYILTSKNSKWYDAAFDGEIRLLQPDWFNKNASAVRENKRKLLELARSGNNRPSISSVNVEEKRLAGILNDYLRKRNGHKYDSAFCDAIKSAAPQWFKDTAAANKAQILEWAATGKKRPSGKSRDPEERRLGSALVCYFAEKRQQYDAIFKQQLIALRPDWIEKRSVLKKEKLLELAKAGATRPNSCSTNREVARLGQALNRYTNPNKQYDDAFTKKIFAIRPEWNTAKLIDEALLNWAENGGRRPNRRSKNAEERRLGRALSNRLSCGGSVADKIRSIRPEWFMKDADNKRFRLLELARNGAKRPNSFSANQEESKLGQALISYTSPFGRKNLTNQKFYEQILSINSNWFKNTINIQKGKRSIASSSINKDKLLNMARSGKDKPSRSQKCPELRKLSALLYSYTSGYCKQYDAAFDKKISELRPDWFPIRKKGPFAN